MTLRLGRRYVPLLATFGVFLAILCAGGVKYEGFFSLRVLMNLFTDNAFLGLCAVGMTFVIISGGIDLSVGAMVAFSSTLIASLTQVHQVPALVAVAVVLVIGVVFGLAQGCAIHYFKAPAFIVTLAGMFLLRGLGFVVAIASIEISDPLMVELSGLAVPLGPSASLTFGAGVLIVAVVAAAVVLGYTRFGRNVYAVGGSEQSVLLMGIRLARTKLAIYALSGFFSALAGIVFSVYTLSGGASTAMGLELEAIAAVVIGGTLLTGGFGFVAGSLVGVLIQGVIQTIIAFEGTLDVSWTKIFVGVLLLVFILLQRVFSHGFSGRAAAARRRGPHARGSPAARR
jgi:ribose/xylose/arabinose/galactoside ABC-type transport system permease subunit